MRSLLTMRGRLHRILRIPPRSVRAQLALWYTAVFAVLMLLFGIAFYTNVQASLLSRLDNDLASRTERIASGIHSESGAITLRDVTGELPGLSSGSHTIGGTTGDVETPGEAAEPGETGEPNGTGDVSIATLVRITNARGQTLYVTPAFGALSVPQSSITTALGGGAWHGTVTARGGQHVRLYSAALIANGTIFGVVQVGESLARIDSAMRAIAFDWLLIAPFALALSALGGYWLAARAFRPIDRLTAAAHQIEAEDLHRRVPVPRTADEVQRLALTFNEMIARLEDAFARQRRFVADASHELRTPVAAIRSLTDVALAEPASADEYAAVLRDVNAETERLGSLIADLLALARADDGQTRIEREPVRLDVLASEVAAIAEPLAAERGITLETRASQPVTIVGDEPRLIQAVMNLLDNALAYTDPGGSVTVEVAAVNGAALVRVRDCGIGIAPEDLPHIFERFYRADPARDRHATGSGLGLAIADWAIQAHDGAIAAESEPGAGTTFTIELPLATNAGAPPGQPTASLAAT
jgi:two-component system, OmpR family, sensor kinase